MGAIDNDLMKEQQPGMPINIDRQSRATLVVGENNNLFVIATIYICKLKGDITNGKCIRKIRTKTGP